MANLTFHETLSMENFLRLKGTETMEVFENKNGNLFGTDDAGNIICNIHKNVEGETEGVVVSKVSNPDVEGDTPNWLVHKRGERKDAKYSFSI